MSETLYRRNADGFLEKAVPEARGKAAAFDRWMAQGEGNPKRMGEGGKFRKGPMKGMTLAQARQKFEGMWAGSSDAIKEKYAGRANSDLAPSERVVPGSTPAVAPQGTAQTRRMASYGHEFKPDGTVGKIGTPARVNPNSTAGAGRGEAVKSAPAAPAPGSDEARAAALTETSQNERFATATVGNYMDMRAAVAAGRGDLETAAVDAAIKKRDQAAEQAKADAFSQSERTRVAEKNRVAMERAGIAPAAAPATPTITPVAQPSTPQPIGSRADDIAGAAGNPSLASTDTRMVMQGKTNGGPTPVNKAVAPMPPGGQTPRTNSLTGLPMGYRPGDEVAPKFKPMADASVARQQSAARGPKVTFSPQVRQPGGQRTARRHTPALDSARPCAATCHFHL